MKASTDTPKRIPTARWRRKRSEDHGVSLENPPVHLEVGNEDRGTSRKIRAAALRFAAVVLAWRVQASGLDSL